MEPALVLFDGDCALCQRVRAYGDGKGRPGLLEFMPAQTDEAQKRLGAAGLTGRERDTLIVFVGPRAYVESAAAVQISRRLRFPHNLSQAMWLVPKPARDWGYRWVAKRRHRM